MKNLTLGFFTLLSLLFFFNSCGSDSTTADSSEAVYKCPMECEGDKTYSEKGSCPVCKMDLMPLEENSKIEADPNEPASQSIFNLTSQWKTQHNETISLKDLKGDVLVMVMIYTSCKAACPRLVADMRNIAAKIENKDVKYVFISIDPEVDTPEKLTAFAKENQMEGDQWIFLQGTVDDVREFSNVLSVKYKQISPIDFSHSNIISVFDKDGVLYHQQEGLGVDNAVTLAKIAELAE